MALRASIVAALPTFAAGSPAPAPAPTAGAATEAREVEIKTSDGLADAYFVYPTSGKYPAVLMWPDIFGLRPAFKEMATRLAQSGYAVLVVNPFYRTKKAPTAPEQADFNDPTTRQALMALAGSLSANTAVVDAKAFLGFLESQAAVELKRKMGTAGYCMGGPFVLRTAANFPDRIGAAAIFHGGGLVTDKPDSPHRLAARATAQYLIAIAENDDQQEPESKNILRDSFAQAHLSAEIEVYAGTLHGWCPPDRKTYNHDQAEKAWMRLIALYRRSLA